MPQARQDTSQLPLCVDLDGSLLLTDTLWESTLKLLAKNILYVFLIPLWLMSGKAAMKRRISERVSLAYHLLPHNEPLVDYLRQQKQAGRKLVLITAADEKIANGIADHLDLFDVILASNGKQNLSGRHKANILNEHFGENGYVYAANAAVDIAVWQHAAAAIVVNAQKGLLQKARSMFSIEKEFQTETRSGLSSVIKAIRPHQWIKNTLLFVPLILSHQLAPESIATNVLAFVAFCLVASAIYVINDLFDLDSDRLHDTKKLRPFASGALSIQAGCWMALVLLILATVLAFSISMQFALIIAGYVLLTSLYTLRLKRMVLIDVLTLTSLYTIRIIAGAVAIDVPVSYWLLTYSIFIFLSLGLVKRYIELHNLFTKYSEKRKARGYSVNDLPVVLLFGVCSGFVSVLVMVLYINDLQASKLYAQPAWLWIVCMAVLYWINRIWLLAHRGELHEDPVLFAVHDRTSYLIVLIVLLSLFLAL